MAAGGTTIIIKKRRPGGHGGAHGGAWKVAYADFVTAMMCFFMVMWLMGADEEIKASISHYFNHPNTPYKSGRDPSSESVHPMGEQAGQGDTVLSGAEGLFPEDLMQLPSRPISQLQENRAVSEAVKEALEDAASGMDANIDSLSFSVPEVELFEPGTAVLNDRAEATLTKLGRIFKNYPGDILIEGHVDPSFAEKLMNARSAKATDGRRSPASAFEFTLSRSVVVMDWLIEHGFSKPEKITPKGSGATKLLTAETAPNAVERNSRVEFTLTRRKSVE